MPGPWDDREPRHGAHDAAARALAVDGAVVVDHQDGGPPSAPTSEYLYNCGCRRMYIADFRVMVEREVLIACQNHRNLLTPEGIQATMGMEPVGKAPEQQEDE